MAYDEDLAERIRERLAPLGAGERRMFGGLAFLVDGSMAVAASGSGGLMVRVDPDESEKLIARDGVERMVMQNRPMRGWLLVAPDRIRTTRQLQPWLDRGVASARRAG